MKYIIQDWTGKECFMIKKRNGAIVSREFRSVER